MQLQAIRRATQGFSEDDCTTMAASLAFYTLFALPPLLYLLVVVISFGMSSIYDAKEARQKAQTFLQNQVSQLIGNQPAAKEVSAMLENTSKRSGVGWRSVISLIGIIAAATGLMTSLQSSLNRIWKVKPDPHKGFAWRFVVKRFFSLAMILGFGFVLLVSLLVSSTLLMFGEMAIAKLGLHGTITPIINHSLTFIVGWIFFVGILKFMPDAMITFRSAVFGGLFTVVLFTIGRTILFLYFQYAKPSEHLGSAAGSIAIVLLWVYYSTVILLFGAEYTVVQAIQEKGIIQAEPGAINICEKEVPANLAADG